MTGKRTKHPRRVPRKKKDPGLRPMPCCGHMVNAASQMPGVPQGREGTPPKPGDVSVCIGCGMWHRYVGTAGPADVRPFGAEDLLELPDEQLHMLRIVTQAIRAWNRAWGSK